MQVGPYNNPQETYNYYALPFCKRKPQLQDEHSWGGLGEVLQGNELINSQLEIKFKGMFSKLITSQLPVSHRYSFGVRIDSKNDCVNGNGLYQHGYGP